MATPIKETVVMEDGREVVFSGVKKKLVKTSAETEGVLSCQLDFRNGATRLFTMPAELLLKFATHGMEQKLGDEIAGIAEMEDCVLAVESLIARLGKGEWSQKRSSNGMAGTSVLIRALVEHTGKDVTAIKGYLADKSQGQKIALRNNPKIKVIVDRIEAEKAANSKAPKVDTDAMLGELDSI